MTFVKYFAPRCYRHVVMGFLFKRRQLWDLSFGSSWVNRTFGQIGRWTFWKELITFSQKVGESPSRTAVDRTATVTLDRKVGLFARGA